jgi:DNA-nicking Smr family endonuclease
MRRPGRQLSPEEREVWARVARTVKPLVSGEKDAASPEAEKSPKAAAAAPSGPPAPPQRARKVKGRVPPPAPLPAKRAKETQPHLDGSWEKRIAKGTLVPDFSLDLHGASLDTAYHRLIHGLTQAKIMGARVVLVVAGKPRPVDAMDRGTQRGAIRAKISDWLAASEHAGDIVAIRGAHRRHGGAGALYVVLKRRR